LHAKLIRRGLPAEYAQRAASEIADHYCDLMTELEATGMSAAQATTEAECRLGDEHLLVKKTVREYQRRYWCARWPLITFFLAPIPVLIGAWHAFGLAVLILVTAVCKLGLTPSSDPDAMIDAFPVALKFAMLTSTFFIVPALVIYGYARLAKRAAVGWQWIVLVACVLSLTTSAMKWERIGPGSRITMSDLHTGQELAHPPQPDFVLMMGLPVFGESWTWPAFQRWFLTSPTHLCQSLLPAALAAALILRWRQLAIRRESYACTVC
jgi:hypothetical protein